MDKEITELNDQISKSITEIARDIEIKYRDYIPNFLGLVTCHEKMQYIIIDSNEQIKKIENQLIAAEKATEKAQEESPHKKHEVLKDFLNRLQILNEMEHCLNTFWLPPNEKMTFDPLSNVRTILRLEELCKNLESDGANNLEAVNERILPLLYTEIQARKNELIQQLDEFYEKFVRFYENERANPPVMVMEISCSNLKAASDNFTSMQRLGIFEKCLRAFVDSFWEFFCIKLIYADEKFDQILKINSNNYSDQTMIFEIKKEVRTTKNPVPDNVFSGLTTLFGGLQQALRGIRVEDRSFVDLFGEFVITQLVSSIEKGCLNPAIPFKKEEAAATHVELTRLTSNFFEFMKEQCFITQPVTELFNNFFVSFERISVDRRCHHYITNSRDLIKHEYIELIEIGSATDREEEKNDEVIKKIEEKFTIKADDVDLSTNIHWDKYYNKSFQILRCKISTSTFKLVNLIQEVLVAASEADSDLEASRLMTTAQNILQMFINTAPEYHKKTLISVPQIAAIFFNNCHYICHRLMTLPPDVIQNVLKLSKITQQDCSFTDMFTKLRELAASILQIHMANARQQLSITIGGKDIFIGLHDEITYINSKKVLDSCLLQIEQTFNIWTNVLSSFVLAQSIGPIASHLLALMADIVLRKEDITSTDAEMTANLLGFMVEKLKKIIIIDGQPLIPKICAESYYILMEIIFCLNSSLAEIGHRWCEGKGPLATWLKPSQVKQLVRAIFQNTDRRAMLLAQIN